MQYDVIIYHSADPDGIFSGAIALKANPDAETIGYNYEKDFAHIIERCLGKRVVMVDVSPAYWVDMVLLCNVCTRVLWIDHHQTAFDKMKDYKIDTAFGNFNYVFDSKCAAADLTWQYFFGYHIPLSVELVSKYDIWDDYGTEDWNNAVVPFRHVAGMIKTPQAVLEQDYFGHRDTLRTISSVKKGRMIAEYIDQQNEIVANSKTLCWPAIFSVSGYGYKVLATNRALHGDMFRSRDMGEFDFAVGYVHEKDGWKVSLRGTGKEFINLGEIAVVFGGGGHKDAAGFRVDSFEALCKIIQRHV